jgi:hypothetical protein
MVSASTALAIEAAVAIRDSAITPEAMIFIAGLLSVEWNRRIYVYIGAYTPISRGMFAVGTP